MEPIISPWLIYLLSVLGNLAYIMGAILVLGGIGVLIILVFISATWLSDGEEKAMNLAKATHFKKTIISCLIVLFLFIFIPSKEDIIGMYIASNLTIDNITKAGDNLSEVRKVIKKDVIDIINSLTIKEKKGE